MAENERAVSFYNLIDAWVGQGIEDFTEGIYDGNPQLNYSCAQRRQHEYLLAQSRVAPGKYLLDIGCGNGTLL